MKLKLKNQAGMTRQVPTGISITGLFFTGFVFITRGVFTRGIVYLMFVYAMQFGGALMISLLFIGEALDGGDGSATAGVANIFYLLLIIPNILFMLKLNKWTARYWMDNGYKPEGEGWATWAPKMGIEIQNND